MKRNKFSGTRKKKTKCTACIELISSSRICSFSNIRQNKPVSERKKSMITENEALEAGSSISKIYDNVVCKTPVFFFPSLIRIRATDGEGNTIEVTY
ncbi:hypothetical protein MSHOH_2281 [Methanosarcina horonobensis HB-1 = JCM 15518]|uniref:Uncharacterized protein n=1 Tax=Methanosarcina horonobensis HB-1 = JCM 15518 TaxID=1434110 RepID=A0A0E3SAL9_9EURY|nr:hypothetical protein [Methanosarcina horonobensis]AKB78764.1 hypothetical protein MSHOH_2281 [Methanosarcina horonobensis HB-1 = JCM 15518]